MTKLQGRAAAALDATHDLAHVGDHTEKMRDYVAAWLDGKRIKISTVRRAIAYLEMVRREMWPARIA